MRGQGTSTDSNSYTLSSMTGKDQARLQKIRTVLAMAAFAIILIAYALHRFRS